METKQRIIVMIALSLIFAVAIMTTCIYGDTETQQPSPSPAPVISQPTPEPAPETPDPFPPCACEIPEGMLAASDGITPPAVMNSKTPDDTFVAGVPHMNGDFITGWGSSAYDLSVKQLTGGYRDTCTITPYGQIILDNSVVCSVVTEYDEDRNKIYTFTLHNYLKWNNGEPITAADYVAGVLAYASPAFLDSGGVSDIGQGIVGYDAYRYGGITDGETGGEAGGNGNNNSNGDTGNDEETGAEDKPSRYFEGIKLLDEFMFSATVSSRYLPDFTEASMVTFRPVYAAGWFPGNEIISDENGAYFKEPIDEDIARIAGTERYAPSVTCGPYNFVSYDGTTVTLERNEYFGVSGDGYIPYFDKIIQTAVPGSEGLELLGRGEIDYLAGIDMNEETREFLLSELIDIPIDIPEEQGEPGNTDNPEGNDDDDPNSTQSDNPFANANPLYRDLINIHTYNRAGYAFLEFNLDSGPTAEYNVRRAIAHMLDRSIIIELAIEGNGNTVDAHYSPAQWLYRIRSSELKENLIDLHHSSDTANTLLDETGWIFEADGETPFDRLLALEDGTYLRHNSDGETLSIRVCAASENTGRAMREAAAINAPLVGMEFTVDIVSMPDLLDYYYYGKQLPEEERVWNAVQLALDFDPRQDLYWTYHSSLADTYLNTNGVQDEMLDEIIMAMRSLQPEQTNEYADLWVQFQARWQQILPAFPLYVNQYFDAYNNAVTAVPVTAYAPYHDVIMHIAKFR